MTTLWAVVALVLGLGTLGAVAAGDWVAGLIGAAVVVVVLVVRDRAVNARV